MASPQGGITELTIAERKLGAEVAVKTVARRVPVSIFTGTMSEEDSLDIARHAKKLART
jgi:dihydrodipicolinate synthase/N-acetylneuraminate lyase